MAQIAMMTAQGGVTHDAQGCDVDAPKVKRKRAKSKYNIFMSEELTRLKAALPEMPHRQRFGMAVQSWKMKIAKAADAKLAEGEETDGEAEGEESDAEVEDDESDAEVDGEESDAEEDGEDTEGEETDGETEA